MTYKYFDTDLKKGDIVTFDFDGTLSLEYYQRKAIELITFGMDVWILTSRFDELHKHLYPLNPTNEDLYEIAEKLGLRSKIIFTNMMPKADYLYSTKVRLHIDDDEIEIREINYSTETKGFLATKLMK